MKKNKKINKKPKLLFIILIVIILIAITTTIIIKNNKKQNKSQQQEIQQDELSLIDMNNTENAKVENGIKENTSENLSKERKLEDLTITDIKLVAQDGVTAFTATVKNDSSKDFKGGIAKVLFTNQDGSNYAELEVYIPEIVAGGTNSINSGTTADIANAYGFTIELEK